MTHPNEGTLVALRDGESITETDRAHILACDVCLEQLDEARVRAELVSDLLAHLGPSVDVDRAKVVVRSTLDGRSTSRVVAGSLRRAAIILLVAAGTVAGLQAPPIRTWMADRFQDGGERVPTAAPIVAVDEARSIGVAPTPGLVIALSGAAPGTRVAITFEARADVEIVAQAPTRFAIAGDRVDASDVEGPVVIRVPRGAPTLSVTAGGRMMFRGTEAEHVRDPAGAQADGAWVFTTPGG